jgi:quercetin dioxygenase-like cupin family protein
MQIYTRTLVPALALFLMGGCSAGPSEDARAALYAEPEVHMSESVTSLFENEYVRVLRFDVAQGVKLPMHEGRKRLIYSLSDYKIAWSEAGQPETVKSWKTGEVHTHDAVEHGLTNVGETPASFLVFERSETELPEPAAAQPNDAAEADAGHAGLLFEDENYRVVRVHLAPGESQPLHEGGWRAIYSLTDYEIGWQEGGNPELSKQWSAGQAHWHEPGPHRATNSGDTPAEWLVVTFKQ